MLRVEREDAGDGAVLHLDASARQGLASVLSEWLTMYAGMRPGTVSQEQFELVVESRRLLLSIVENCARERAAPRRCNLLEDRIA